MAVTRTSAGAMASSAAAVTVTFGAGAAPGDFGILIVETANQAITTPTGWTLARQIGFGTAGTAGASMLSIYQKTSITAGDIASGIPLSDSGDHQNAVLLTYSGVDVNSPFLQTSSPSSASAATTSVSGNGVTAGTVMGAGVIVLAIVGTDRDSATVSTNTSPVWNNVAGSNSFIINASSATGAGGGIIVNELVPTAPATGTVTFSCSITSSAYNLGLFSLPPINPPFFNRQSRLAYMEL